MRLIFSQNYTVHFKIINLMAQHSHRLVWKQYYNIYGKFTPSDFHLQKILCYICNNQIKDIPGKMYSCFAKNFI